MSDHDEYQATIEEWVKDLGPDAWIGVDLDGTWAKHTSWLGPLHIGEPIQAMTDRVKVWLAAGLKVKVMTARASRDSRGRRDKAVINVIQDWTEALVGRRLEVTNEKDYCMVQLWDDRAVQVIPNTGRRADGLE